MVVTLRLLLAIAALATASEAKAAVEWSSLWRNADQRGEQLLRSGDAAGAAKTYADPRRKAYAELQAGDNDAAARDLAPFDDSDAHYNRGNALARGGKLQEALNAYDSALAHNPDNQDARRNRDLVEKALQQQKQQQSSKGQDGNDKNGKDQQDDKRDQSQGTNSKNGSGDQPQNQKSQPDQSGSKDGNDKQANDSQSGKDGNPQAGDQPKIDSPQKDSSGTQNTSSKSGNKDGKQEQANQTAGNQPSEQTGADEKQQAQRDAAAGLRPTDKDQKQPADVSTAASAADPGKPGGDPTVTAPISEQKLAEDQWLRRIPDDPGGLLRRKFLIEHMLKQQQQDPQQNPP